MVIDKTTGKGCAWSIASKAITRRLIAEGIVGKTICRRHRRNSKTSYELLQVDKFKHDDYVYVISKKDNGLEKVSLWTPSFVDAGVWEQVVSRFPNYERLDQNIEKWLLPEMEAYLRSIPDSELISMVRDFLIGHGILNRPIRQHGGKTYYFDKNEIYSLDKKSELFPYEGHIKFNMFTIKGETCFNMNVWSKASVQFEVGRTLHECIEIFLQTELSHKDQQVLSPLDQLVQYIAPPTYERVPGNNDVATFDRIRVSIGLPRYRFDSWEDLGAEVKKYQRKIYQQVLQRLKDDRKFKKYGVPVNFLKLSNVMLLRDFSIEFIFELKEPKVDLGLGRTTTTFEREEM